MRVWLLLLIIAPSAYGNGYTLDEILAFARKNAQKEALYLTKVAQAQTLAKQARSAFDTQLNGEYVDRDDRGLLNQYTDGDRRYHIHRKLDISRYFPTGTGISIGSTWQQDKVESDLPLTQISPLQLPRFNDVHTLQYGITIKQDLWRNYGAKIIFLQEQIATTQSIPSRYEAAISVQAKQYESASLYIQLVNLNQTLFLAEQLELESKNFVTLMDKRRKIGRADDVDLATAKTELVKRSGLVLDIRIQRDLVQTRLLHACFGPRPPKTSNFPRTLPQVRSIASANEIERLAYSQRLDLHLLEELKSIIQVEKELYREEAKPDVEVFAQHEKRGLGDDLAAARKDASHGTVNTVGIKFSWNLENKAPREKKAALSVRKSILNQEIQILKDTISQDIAIAVQNFQSAQSQELQAQRQIISLGRNITAETTKYRQARSDKAALTKYRIEVLLAKMERWDAYFRKAFYANELNWLSHNYPKGGNSD